MAHHLAEAICELAAPPLQPSFIRLVGRQDMTAGVTLLLHVRPRPLAAGAEVAVYSGVAEDEDATVARLDRQGAVYAVRQSQAGLEQFVADLVATSPEEWDEWGPIKLALPRQHSMGQAAWDSMQLQLLSAGKVQACPHEGPQPPSPLWLRVRMPSTAPGEGAMATAEVLNGATAHVRRQEALKRQLEKQRRQQAAAVAAEAAAATATSAAASPAASSSAAAPVAVPASSGPAAGAAASTSSVTGTGTGTGTGSGATAAASARPQPDSKARFDQKYRALRDEAMAELKAALLAMLRHALRFRGTLEFPGAPPLPPAAPPAAAQQAGEQAGDAADP